MSAKRVVVIGAGVGGMAVANLLAKDGYRVTVVEKNSQPGGRAGQWEKDGFVFDTGPSWYLMPEVFEQYFELLGYDINKLLKLKRLDPAYKVFYDYRDPVVARSDEKYMEIVFEEIEPGAGGRLKDYLDEAERTYSLAMENILYDHRPAYRAVAKRAVISNLPTMIGQILKPLHQKVVSRFKSLPLQQILEYPMVFLGASPYQAPSLFQLMSYLDFRQGVFYPDGGMYEVIKAFKKVDDQLGVKYRFDAEVTEIVIDGGITKGVIIDGELLEADVVISNADLHHTETQLVKPQFQSYPESYWAKKQAGPSALLMYLGVDGKLPQLEHHNLLFVERWQENFNDIYLNRRWPEHPSMYICKPSASDSSVAPKGDENLFVLVPLPAGDDIDEASRDRLAEQYLQQISKHLGIPDLAERIKVKRYHTPSDFGRELNAWQNTALGMSHLLKQSAWWRPGHKSRKVNNLWYVGAAVQPGIGVPMCLIGAELTYKQIVSRNSSKRAKS